MEKIGIENIKQVLLLVINIVREVKNKQKPLSIILLNYKSLIKINFKNITKEVKDIDSLERIELINFFIENGFKDSIAKKALENIISKKKTTMLNLIKTLLKTK